MSFIEGYKKGLELQKGMTTLGALGVSFITMKLLGAGAVASWSWWLVLAPFWGPAALVIAFIVLFLIGVCTVAAIGGLYKGWKGRG